MIRDIPKRILPFKCWLPYSLSTPVAYWISYAHQTIAHYYGANINIAFDAHFAALMMATCAQLQILKHRFHSMHKIIENNQKSEDNFDNNQDELEKKLLADCTLHHLAIFQLSFIEFFLICLTFFFFFKLFVIYVSAHKENKTKI